MFCFSFLGRPDNFFKTYWAEAHFLAHKPVREPASKPCGVLWQRSGKRKDSLQLPLRNLILHRKSRSEMLIGGDDISNDVIPLGTCFSRSFPLRADWQRSDSSVEGERKRNWRRNSNSKDVVASSPSFSRPAARAPRRACSVLVSNS